MVGSELIKVKIEEDVAILTISRPEGNKVNVLTSQIMKELDQALDEFSKEESVKVIVITGEGPYTFVAGADVKEIAGIHSDRKSTRLNSSH